MPSFRSGISAASLCAVALAQLRGGGRRTAASTFPANASAAAPPRVLDQEYVTDITHELQGLIESDRGVIVRDPFDFGVNSAYRPASLWSNSIYTPNQLYIWDEHDQKLYYWQAHLAIVVDDPYMDNLLADTYYGHDANACDSSDSDTTRCYYEEGGSNRWNCPGGYKYNDGTWEENSNAKGSGSNQCRGCHFANDQGTKDLDQDMSPDFVGTDNCDCPAGVSADEYVQRILDKGFMQDAAWSADRNTCWSHNKNFMIQIQNQLWWQFKTAQGLTSDATKTDYWGWNEIGVDKKIDDPANQNWKALLVFLPAASELSLTRLDNSDQWEFHDKLKAYEGKGWLVPGAANIASRPGSYIVMAKEEDDGTGSGNFMKHFFCESWELQGSELKICFKPWDPADPQKEPGYCYVEKSTEACA